VTKTWPGSFNDVLTTHANGMRKVSPSTIMARCKNRLPILARHFREMCNGDLLVAVILGIELAPG
jgi:hypothetical protein